jgi:hypothetical protein
MSCEDNQDNNSNSEECLLLLEQVRQNSARISRLVLEIVEHKNVPSIFKNNRIVKEVIK